LQGSAFCGERGFYGNEAAHIVLFFVRSSGVLRVVGI
jgi:hypothetical protein